MESANEFIKRASVKLKASKPLQVPDITRDGMRSFALEAVTFMQQSDHPKKILRFDRLRLIETVGTTDRKHTPGEVQYRIGYYMIGLHGKSKGQWRWGQFCPLIPQQDLQRLLDKARREGTIQ